MGRTDAFAEGAGDIVHDMAPEIAKGATDVARQSGVVGRVAARVGSAGLKDIGRSAMVRGTQLAAPAWAAGVSPYLIVGATALAGGLALGADAIQRRHDAAREERDIKHHLNEALGQTKFPEAEQEEPGLKVRDLAKAAQAPAAGLKTAAHAAGQGVERKIVPDSAFSGAGSSTGSSTGSSGGSQRQTPPPRQPRGSLINIQRIHIHTHTHTAGGMLSARQMGAHVTRTIGNDDYAAHALLEHLRSKNAEGQTFSTSDVLQHMAELHQQAAAAAAAAHRDPEAPQAPAALKPARQFQGVTL